MSEIIYLRFIWNGSSTYIVSDDYKKTLTPGPGEIDIGRFRITTYPCIGQGAFGRVCRALDTHSGRLVAAKEIQFEENEEIEETCEMMQQIKYLSHIHLVQILDFIVDRNICWLFMENCELGDLAAYLKGNHDMSLRKRATILYHIASALEFLHSNDIIHRDVKPQNVLMKRILDQDIAKLGDFDTAKLYTMRTDRHSHYMCFHTVNKGTVAYNAPELLKEYQEEEIPLYTTTVDVFSLGLLGAVLLDYSEENPSLFPVSGKCPFSLVLIFCLKS